MIERHPAATILGVRFMYGLRTVGPAVIGTTRVSLPRFVALNAVGALVWSACWAGAGYLVGKAAEQLLGDLARIEREVFGGAHRSCHRDRASSSLVACWRVRAQPRKLELLQA